MENTKRFEVVQSKHIWRNDHHGTQHIQIVGQHESRQSPLYRRDAYTIQRIAKEEQRRPVCFVRHRGGFISCQKLRVQSEQDNLYYRWRIFTVNAPTH